MRRAIALDTETTGLDPLHNHVVEIAFQLVDTETGRRLDSYQNVVALTEAEWAQAAPKALAVNGFTWAEVRSRGVPRDTIRSDICAFFAKHHLTASTAFFLCQNPSFDKSFFVQLCPADVQRKWTFPYHWYDLSSMNWALEARAIARGEKDPYAICTSKDGIAWSHGLDREAAPHRAMNGVDHMLAIYEKIVGFFVPP
uniref:Exonuclease n=1 Tax=Marseillevirus LCMAC103 TaxID=2506604 RepID=A0A481YUZ3_9VIRU|nr:MAG: exonuclease [Marseillevirus LCMAC103]